MRTERVVSVPVPEGSRIPGIPQNGDGFVPTDEYGRVRGRDDVFAAGDMTTFPIKQGGIAAQQADAAAESIAALAGASITPEPFRPVLRGLLLTGLRPRFLRANLLDSSSGSTSSRSGPRRCRAVPGPVPGAAPGITAETPPRPADAAQRVEVERAC
jgi:sulfide:quinone oxidoreductase